MWHCQQEQDARETDTGWHLEEGLMKMVLFNLGFETHIGYGYDGRGLGNCVNSWSHSFCGSGTQAQPTWLLGKTAVRMLAGDEFSSGGPVGDGSASKFYWQSSFLCCSAVSCVSEVSSSKLVRSSRLWRCSSGKMESEILYNHGSDISWFLPHSFSTEITGSKSHLQSSFKWRDSTKPCTPGGAHHATTVKSVHHHNPRIWWSALETYHHSCPHSKSGSDSTEFSWESSLIARVQPSHDQRLPGVTIQIALSVPLQSFRRGCAGCGCVQGPWQCEFT